MRWIRISFGVFVYTTFLFLLGDFAFTKLIGIPSLTSEQRFRIAHDFYHHTFQKNFNGQGIWGANVYEMCTDEHGFKVSCSQKILSGNTFDIAFIGDSFTEAIGMTYENSFVGVFSRNYPQLRVANLAVASYSPSIYLNKIERLLEEGLYFDHVIVFIDISDVQDEGTAYLRTPNGSIYQRGKINKEPSSFYTDLKALMNNNFQLFTFAYKTVKKLYSSEIEDEERAYALRLALNRVQRSEWTYNANSEYYGDLGVEGAIKKAVDNMNQLHTLLSSKDIKLSVGVYPWPEQLRRGELEGSRQETIWRDFCEKRCKIFINVFPTFKTLVENNGVETVYQKYFLQNGVHFNEYGNEVISETLIKKYDSWLVGH